MIRKGLCYHRKTSDEMAFTQQITKGRKGSLELQL